MARFRRSRPRLVAHRPSLTASARRSEALTAAGQRVNAKSAEQNARVNSSWQKRVFMYYDALGEIKYAAAFYARLAKLELFVGEWTVGDDGERELKPTKDAAAVAALDRIRDPGGSGSRAGLLASYGRIKFLAGEGYLFFTADEDGMEKWEFLSTSEIRPNPLGTTGSRVTYQRVKAPALAPEEYRDPGEDQWVDVQAKEAIAYRFWRRHPQYSEWPDSPMRGVLDVCEELLILDATVRARSRSRLSGNGILWIDDRISTEPTPTEELGPTPDEDISNDPWLDDLTSSMIDPIADEGDASRLVPLITRVTVPLEPGLKLSDLVYHQKLTDANEVDNERGKRLEAIQRLALGLEMPAEVLTGMSQSNHWTAWEISDDAWEHLEPFAQEFCDDVTAGYLLPTLKAAKHANWDKFAVGFDAGRLRTEPEKSKDAKDVHKAGELSGRALRTATGFTEADSPSPEERRTWLSVYSRDPGFALGDDPKGTGTNPLERVSETVGTPAGEAVPGGPPADDAVGGPGGSPQETVKGPPPGDGVTASALTVAHVLGACDVGRQRARILANNRLRSRAKRDPEVLKLLDARRDDHGPAVLGADVTRRYGTDRDLVTGLHDVLGYPLASLVGNERSDLIVAAVEQHAALTLYDESLRQLPAQLRSYITGICNTNGNGNGNGHGPSS